MFRDFALVKLLAVTALGLLAVGLMAPDAPRASAAKVTDMSRPAPEENDEGQPNAGIVRTGQTLWNALFMGPQESAAPAGTISEAEAIERALAAGRAAEEGGTSELMAAVSAAVPEDAAAAPEVAEIAGDAAAPWRVTGSAVNLRAGPGTSHDVVGQVVEGDALIPLGDTGGDWIEVETATGGTGWIFARFLEPEQG